LLVKQQLKTQLFIMLFVVQAGAGAVQVVEEGVILILVVLVVVLVVLVALLLLV
jgi:hypothetical protein